MTSWPACARSSEKMSSFSTCPLTAASLPTPPTVSTSTTSHAAPEETAESELIRTSLHEIGDNGAVRQAVASVGARYLLVLDGYGWDEDIYTALGDYWPNMWSGLEVTDETPGFEVVLADGPLRLYRIVE